MCHSVNATRICCLLVCVYRMFGELKDYRDTGMCKYFLINIYMYVCVCVCVCVFE